MAKRDWCALQQEYLSAYAKSGVSPKAWCEQKGLIYNSARRHIKKPKAQEPAQSAQPEKAQNCATAQDAQITVATLEDELGLTPKQARFCLEYIVDLNATQAAIRAGYSEASAHNIGPANLAKPRVASAIRELQTASAQRTMITADRVLAEMAKIGFANFQDYTDSHGALANIANIPRDVAAAIKEVKVKVISGEQQDIEETTFKLHDKRAALVDLAKHLNLFERTAPDPVEVDLDSVTDEELDAEIARYEGI